MVRTMKSENEPRCQKETSHVGRITVADVIGTTLRGASRGRGKGRDIVQLGVSQLGLGSTVEVDWIGQSPVRSHSLGEV